MNGFTRLKPLSSSIQKVREAEHSAQKAGGHFEIERARRGRRKGSSPFQTKCSATLRLDSRAKSRLRKATVFTPPANRKLASGGRVTNGELVTANRFGPMA